MVTADKYRTAAKVLDSLSPVDGSPAWFLRADLYELAEKVEARDEFFRSFGVKAMTTVGGNAPILVGTELVKWLLDLGWEAPEGLL